MSEYYFKLEIKLPMFLAGSSLLSQKGYGKGGGGNPKVSKGRKNGIAQAENKRPGEGAAGILSKSSVEVNFSFLLFAADSRSLCASTFMQWEITNVLQCKRYRKRPKALWFQSSNLSLSFLALF